MKNKQNYIPTPAFRQPPVFKNGLSAFRQPRSPAAMSGAAPAADVAAPAAHGEAAYWEGTLVCQGASAPVPLPLHSRVCSSCASVLFLALAPPARRSCRPRRTSRPPPPGPRRTSRPPPPAPLPPRRGHGGASVGGKALGGKPHVDSFDTHACLSTC